MPHYIYKQGKLEMGLFQKNLIARPAPIVLLIFEEAIQRQKRDLCIRMTT